MKTEKANIEQYWNSVRKDCICPVCGKRRGTGKHAKCSKITQMKHQQQQSQQ
jgi:rubredoxin